MTSWGAATWCCACAHLTTMPSGALSTCCGATLCACVLASSARSAAYWGDSYITAETVKAEGVAMLESTLHGLTPKDVSTFPKLSQGDPYHFDRWENGCPYYWFEGVKNIRNVFPYLKFVLVSVNSDISAGLAEKCSEKSAPQPNRMVNAVLPCSGGYSKPWVLLFIRAAPDSSSLTRTRQRGCSKPNPRRPTLGGRCA
jgi:hypothetical protein